MSDQLPDVDGPQVVLPDHDSPLARQLLTAAQSEAERDWERARLTVIETVAHQQVGQAPFSLGVPYQRWLESQEERYSRTLKVGEEWTPLDCGWVKEASLLLIRNEEGSYRTRNPTEEEKAVTAAKVLEVAAWLGEDILVMETLDVVGPQESIRRIPARLDNLMIRCRSGVARYRILVVPR